MKQLSGRGQNAPVDRHDRGRRARQRRAAPVPATRSRRWFLAHLIAATGVVVLGVTVWVLAIVRTPASEAGVHQHHSSTPAAEPGAHHHETAPDESAADGSASGISVADLTGPRDGVPDVRYELTARTATITTDTGRVISALTYNGTAPGPLLRARAGQLVEVVLHNADVTGGVTIHWHGLDVPNAEDGVAGVTQDAVMPGQQHVYRFRPTQVGTFWYHSHQDAATAVARGLFGPLIIDPAVPDDAAAADGVFDLPLVAHTWTDASAATAQETTIGLSGRVSRYSVSQGRTVRLRLVNTDSVPQTWTVSGAAYRVTAIDGTAVTAPTDLVGTSLRLAGGGRYDVELSMPPTPVTIRLLEVNQPGVQLVPGDDTAGDGAPVAPETLPPAADAPRFDPLSYGSPQEVPPFGGATAFDRDVTEILQTEHGRRNGVPYVYWTINGQTYPDIPAITVTSGDLVRVHISNEGTDVHPMHLHGHHALVLSRNGQPATGSPWWTDTLGVEPGEDYVVAFRADNPGIWMDHCHNLSHAAAGMMMHLEYDGVRASFSMDHGNLPE